MQDLENLDHDQLVHVVCAMFNHNRQEVIDRINAHTRAGLPCGHCTGILEVLTSPSICPCCEQVIPK